MESKLSEKKIAIKKIKKRPINEWFFFTPSIVSDCCIQILQ